MIGYQMKLLKGGGRKIISMNTGRSKAKIVLAGCHSFATVQVPFWFEQEYHDCIHIKLCFETDGYLPPWCCNPNSQIG